MRMAQGVIWIVGILCLVPQGAGAATYTVSPGMSIQDALDKAKPGDTVQVLVGEYTESLRIDTEGLRLAGLAYEGERPVLSGAGEFERLDVAVTVDADHVTVEGFVIRGYTRAGVVAEKVRGVRFHDLIIDRSGPRGIAVRHAQDVSIDGCIVSGAEIAGIHIADCTAVQIRNSEMFSNGIGIRIDDSSESRVENNSAHNNSVGLLLLRTPGEHPQPGSYSKVIQNRFHANNREMTSGQDAVTRRLAPGIGVLIVAADYTEIARCTFSGNEAYAAMVMGYGFAKLDGEFVGEDDTLANADHTFVHHNIYRENGLSPSKAFEKRFKRVPGGDLYWDGTGERNQWQEDGELRTVPEKLVQEHGGAHTNVMHFL
ncbi:MAG: right-handed parallel beta-helix repeat-containing protein [Candidatus Hydrogenedentes bacterium]|nr:right-handed parallel beta-helix repeat-containing protein [Candidatus Hydrogenedentota bacterium]